MEAKKKSMSEKMITLKINNCEITVPEGTTILEAAKKLNIDIPTLCYLKDINAIGACRMCLVEVKGARALQASCVYPVAEGIEVFTNTPNVRGARKTNLELVLSDHNRECTICERSGKCELQKLSNDLGVKNVRFSGELSSDIIDDASSSIVRDESKCILCKRCIAVCKHEQATGSLGAVGRGFTSKARPVFNNSLQDVNCIGCGQCIVNCPVAALKEKSSTEQVWDAINDESKYVIVQPAPAVRAALGEEFGYPMGTSVTGKMAAALRRLGFTKIFDVDFAADVTIMEEANELIHRVTNGGVLPMITSCSPGWVRYAELNYPELLPHLSSCKSPQAMNGALLKSHYAEKHNIDPKDMVVVSVMPCTAKKHEIAREELTNGKLPDVDISITTRELASMIKEAGLDFNSLPEEDFDAFYGESTGAGVIFGATGGVMEAAARTAVEVISGKESDNIEYHAVRGIEGIKEAEVVAGDLTIKVAVAHGGKNLQTIMDKVKNGEADYHFIELMACPGGCVNGGGQPIVDSVTKREVCVPVERAKALYREDAEILEFRKSHLNPSVIALYDEYLEKPNSHKAHELLHTTYKARPKYTNKSK